MAGEYTVEAIAGGVAAFLARHAPELPQDEGRAWLDAIAARRAAVARELAAPLPPRPPQFCIGCPERPVFAALKLLQQETGRLHIAADIGCHSFATFEPFNSGHTILGYGMSLASRAGVSPMLRAADARDHGRRRVLAQRRRVRRAVGALQRRRRGAAHLEERLYVGDRHAGHPLDARGGARGGGGEQGREPRPHESHDRADARGHGRQVAARGRQLRRGGHARDTRRRRSPPTSPASR